MFKRTLVTVVVASITLASVAYAAHVFSDVPDDHWAADAIMWANDSGLMTGPADMAGMFDPAGAVNRAQLATVLNRYDMAMKDKMDAMMMEMETKMEDMMTPGNPYMASLDGKQAGVMMAAGTGSATMKLVDNDLSYSVTVADLSGAVTAAHFHLGEEGISGAPVHTIEFTDMMGEGTWMDMTDEEIRLLLTGGYYVNIHTATYPDGEIRGQVWPGMM